VANGQQCSGNAMPNMSSQLQICNLLRNVSIRSGGPARWGIAEMRNPQLAIRWENGAGPVCPPVKPV
jgi:hypothetical protein